MKILVYALVLLFGICGQPAIADTLPFPPMSIPSEPAPPPPPDTPPMRVIIVHSNEAGCEPNCAAWISAEGRIVSGTPALFRRALAAMGSRKLPVLVSSYGGDVASAMEIGRLIRGRGLDVAVSATWLQPCEATGKHCGDNEPASRLGEPHSNAASCSSACVYLLAAGRRRIVSYDVGVAVHEASETRIFREIQHIPMVDPVGRFLGYRSKVLSSYKFTDTPSDAVYERSAAYFRQMGIRGDLVALMHEAAYSDAHWMTMDELDSTGLATNRFSPESLIASLNHPDRPTQEPPVPKLGWVHQEGANDSWQQAHSLPKGFYTPVRDPPIVIIKELPLSYMQIHPSWPVPAIVLETVPPVKLATEEVSSTDLQPKPVVGSMPVTHPQAAPAAHRKATPKTAMARQEPGTCEAIRTIPAMGMHLTGRVMVVFPPGAADIILARVETQLGVHANPKYFEDERVGVRIDSGNMFGMANTVLIPRNLRAAVGDEVAFVTRHQDGSMPCHFVPNLATTVRAGG